MMIEKSKSKLEKKKLNLLSLFLKQQQQQKKTSFLADAEARLQVLIDTSTVSLEEATATVLERVPAAAADAACLEADAAILHGAAASAKPQTSKPSDSALARMAPGTFLEIEVVIVAGGDQARPAVGQQRAEARPALELHVPGLDRREVRPGHIAEIVDHRQVGRGGEIGQR